MPRICILGGGFGGLFTALHLTKLPWRHQPELFLVDRRDHFLFSPLLYELLTQEVSIGQIAPTFDTLLAGTGIRFHRGEVTAFDPQAKLVTLTGATGQEVLTYDDVVLSLGNEAPLDLVPGARDYALPFRTLDDALRLDRALSDLEASDREKIRVCIAGAGGSGVELAGKLSDRLRERGRIRLIDRNSQILPQSPAANRRHAERILGDRGVWIDLKTSVVGVAADAITLEFQGIQEALPADLVLWTVGNRRPSLLQSLSLNLDSTLQCRDDPHLFALGDCAVPFLPYPATAQVAFQQSGYCAYNIWARYHGQRLLPFTYLPLGEFVSLGVGEAAAALFNVIGIHGAIAAQMRRWVYLLRMPTLDHQLRVAGEWLGSLVNDQVTDRMSREAEPMAPK